MLNDDVIVTSRQAKSDDDDTDEDEDSINESSNSPSNAGTFSALEIAMEWYEQQSECCPTQLLLFKRFRLCSENTKAYNVPTDDVVPRVFIESSALEHVAAIHSGMVEERAGLVSSQANPVEVYSTKVTSRT
ncbi:hypothetical protein TNCV_540301 [Trichonephila clavipes]|nr:hypothetical protein TNCV_540301 [Trichonephila clavipes]